MTRIDNRISRRSALAQLTAATMFVARAAKAQPPEEEVLVARPFADLDEKWAGERDSVNFVRVVYNSFKRS